LIDAAAIGTWRRRSPDRILALDGERLAVGTTAAAVAMLPLLVPSGPANLGPIDLLIAIGVFACLFWAGSSGHRWRFAYATPMALFIAAGALGALIGPVPGAGIVAIGQDIFLLAWCWAVANISHSPASLRVLVTTWAYSSIVWGVLLFVGVATGSSFLSGNSGSEGTRTALTFVDPNVSANYYFISIMMIWASRRPRHRGLRLVAYALLLAALISTGSNSGIVSVIVGVAVAAVVGAYRRGGTLPAVTALAFFVLGGYLVVSSASVRDIQERASASRYAVLRNGIGRGDASVTERSALLRESIPLFKIGGAFGQGPVSTKPRLNEKMAPYVKEAHDDYLAALLERGAIGFVGLLLLFAAIGARAFSLNSGRLSPGFAAAVMKPNALVGAFAGTIVAGTAYEFLHLRHVWTLFAFIAALYTWGRE
jgi:O-antigen ligase